MPTATEAANIALRREAQEFVDLLGEKPAHFWRCLAEIAAAKHQPPPAEVGPQRATPATVRQIEAQAKQARGLTVEIGDPRYDKAMDLIEQIEELAEQVPTRGQEFAESALETAKSIGETIEERHTATISQIAALENIEIALQNWIH